MTNLRPRWRVWAIDEDTGCTMIADCDAQLDEAARGTHENGRRPAQTLARHRTDSARRRVRGLRYEAHPPGVTPLECRVLEER